jgi:hypothetical protein
MYSMRQKEAALSLIRKTRGAFVSGVAAISNDFA